MKNIDTIFIFQVLPLQVVCLLSTVAFTVTPSLAPAPRYSDQILHELVLL